MITISYITLFTVTLIAFLILMRGTVFQISLRNNVLGGALIAREIFILILLGSALFGIYGPSQFNTVHVKADTVHETGSAIFTSTLLLITSISIFSNTLFRRYLRLDKSRQTTDSANIAAVKTLIRSVAILLFALTVASQLTGMSHAFWKSLYEGGDLLTNRLANRYSSETPSHIKAYLKYSYCLLTALLGFFGSGHIKGAERIAYISLITYSSTLSGEKASIVQAIIVYAVCRASSTNIKPAKLLLAGGVILALTVTLIFVAVRIQYPTITTEEFALYLIDRLGVGQIQGVYEQLSLKLMDWEYVLIEVPFIGFFTEPKIFSKDLMLSTWAQGMNPSDVGVMNTFFIAEAYAIGGPLLLYLSPIFVAFNFCLITHISCKIFKLHFSITKKDAQLIIPIFISSILMFTGDLNGMLLGKRLFLILIFYASIFAIKTILENINKTRPNQNRIR
ncbi:hypothetical protein [Diaphorobacter sp. JS3051]|uniref:hypothetical protein n=1 Tax=Diaphorobacter sp. JS3051 TaxID=2792224 RepID=UPI0018CBD025|nr:hypothetical protein [Diaphorobacter sp. JS3051]QPN33194.1 hypothetical protein I3K84_21205 [Diaphorobacter sp. JS3051]